MVLHRYILCTHSPPFALAHQATHILNITYDTIRVSVAMVAGSFLLFDTVWILWLLFCVVPFICVLEGMCKLISMCALQRQPEVHHKIVTKNKKGRHVIVKLTRVLHSNKKKNVWPKIMLGIRGGGGGVHALLLILQRELILNIL